MARPLKPRRVEVMPEVSVFKPAGVPMRELDEVVLTVDEFEALRLKDLEALEQEDCALRMNISRPTFQRILTAGRTKVADALTNGKLLRVEGGSYRLAMRKFRCLGCNHEFDLPFGSGQRGLDARCPECDTTGAQRVGERGRGKRFR
ncbi:MAG: DUF134 domain-containing protein [Firmicutes bacterium]|nr:DUF134 domain-containing protein [Bacillota bacterium]